MTNLYKLFLTLFLLCTSIAACKLDPPVFPADKGSATGSTGVTGSSGSTGTTGATGVISAAGTNPQLTGKWLSRSVVYQTFDLSYHVIKSEPDPDILYDYVLIDDATQTARFVNSEIYIDQTDTYTVTKENGKTYIHFSQDPFFRTGNFRIEVILAANTMTWVVIDPKEIDESGMKGYIGTQILFY